MVAAHCFWDVATEQKMPLNFFQVAAGKYYRDYDMAKDPTAQIADVAEVVFSSRYKSKAWGLTESKRRKERDRQTAALSKIEERPRGDKEKGKQIQKK